MRRRHSLLLTLALCGLLALLLLCGAGALGVYYLFLVAAPQLPAVPPGGAAFGPGPQAGPPPIPGPGFAQVVVATRDPWATAAVADFMGLPPDGNFRGDYVFVNVRVEQGPPPPEGHYRLAWGSVNFNGGLGVGSGGDPVIGPFLRGELPPGSRLTNLRPLCVFEARSRGYQGKQAGFATASAPMRYTLFEGTVGRSPTR